MKVVLLLNLLVASAAASDAAVDNGPVRLRGGGRNLKGHKGPKPTQLKERGGQLKTDLKGATGGVEGAPEASPDVSSRMTPKTQGMGRMELKNGKKKITQEGMSIPSVQDEPAKYLGLDDEEETDEDKHDFRMEVKLAKKQGKLAAAAPVPSPAAVEDNLPPAPPAAEEEEGVPQELLSTEDEGVYPTKPSEHVDGDMHATITSVSVETETEPETTKKMKKMKGHAKKADRVKKDHSKKERTQDGGMESKMKPQHKTRTSDHGRNKKTKPTMSMNAEDDKKAKKKMKKMDKKHKKELAHEEQEHEQEQEHETMPSEVPAIDNEVDSGYAQTTPVPPNDEEVVEMVNPAPATTTPEPTSEPTPAPFDTPAPSTGQPTTDAPVVAQVITPRPTLGLTDSPTEYQWPTYSPTAGPPECPPAYDSSITNENSDPEDLYVADQTAEVSSHIFECNPEFVFYCNEPASDETWPADAQNAWSNAWTHVGPCVPPTEIAGMGLLSAEVEATDADVAGSEWQTYELSTSALLKYRLSDAGDSVSMEVIHDGADGVWLGLAFSRTGHMVGSEAIIGQPANSVVQKFDMLGQNESAVVPMSESKQTLSDASIEVNEYGQTIMKFTKLLVEQDEIEVTTGKKNRNIMLFAHGSDDILGYHGGAKTAFELTI